MEPIPVALLTALLAGGIGYSAKWREQIRDRKIAYYAEAGAAFIALARSGAVYVGLLIQHYNAYDGWVGITPDHPAIRLYSDHQQAFEAALTRARIVAGPRVALELDRMRCHLEDNIHAHQRLARSRSTENHEAPLWPAQAEPYALAVLDDFVVAATKELRPGLFPSWRGRR